MAGTLRIRITESQAQIRDLRFRYIWSAWLDDRLIGEGHTFNPEQLESWVLDLVSPDEVEHIEVIQR